MPPDIATPEGLAELRRAIEARETRQTFYKRIGEGKMTVPEGLRQMRAMLGMTQAQFGARFKLTTRQVSELENGRANPTAETLNRLGKPFGLQVGFIKVENA